MVWSELRKVNALLNGQFLYGLKGAEIVEVKNRMQGLQIQQFTKKKKSLNCHCSSKNSMFLCQTPVLCEIANCFLSVSENRPNLDSKFEVNHLNKNLLIEILQLSSPRFLLFNTQSISFSSETFYHMKMNFGF